MAKLTNRALNTFFRSRGDALEAASEAALKEVGAQARNMANRQLKSRFKNRAGRASAKYYKAKSGKPETLYLVVKPAFLRIFEEGATIKGDRYLVIPIPPFKRVGGRGWSATFQRLKQAAKIAIIPVDGGYLVTADKQPAYKLQRAVDLKQRTDITDRALDISKGHPDIMDRLLNAKI